MSPAPQGWMYFFVVTFLAIHARISEAQKTLENGVKTGVYLSPKITLQPGSVANKKFWDVDFPTGHIAVKSFDAEVVDEAGKPVPLHDTYLHHWLAERYYKPKGLKVVNESVIVRAGNSGLCKNNVTQNFGLGSETRKTSTHVPDPYGIEVGNPSKVPAGHEEKWMFNIHAIDTRGTKNRMGCDECRCQLYNVTKDEFGQPLGPNYLGGMSCCYEGTQCEVKDGIESIKRNVYLRYTVKWVEWDESIVPVKTYIIDVTDTWTKSRRSHDCMIEYNIEPCAKGLATNGCIDTRTVSLSFPAGGDVIYGVTHQHAGGVGSALYGEDGRLICVSRPKYGRGKEAGNEAGYAVGMTTCYPKPGTVKITEGETLTLVSNYSSAKRHTGVMGLFYILLAESRPQN